MKSVMFSLQTLVKPGWMTQNACARRGKHRSSWKRWMRCRGCEVRAPRRRMGYCVFL